MSIMKSTRIVFVAIVLAVVTSHSIGVVFAQGESVPSSTSLNAAATSSPPIQGWVQPDSASTSNQNPAEKIDLKAVISFHDGPAPDELVGNLVNAALAHDKSNDLVMEKDQHMHGHFAKAKETAKLAAQYMTGYRGFEISSEAADIILDEKLRLKNVSSVEYAKQRKADEAHAKIFSLLLQLAQGLGTTDADKSQKIVSESMAPLTDLVGKELADSTLHSLKNWSEQLTVPPFMLKQEPWTMRDMEQKTQDLIKESAQADPVMGLVRRALHKYNQHSKLALGAAKAINITLSIASSTPTLASPVASILQFVFSMSTGGPEDYKLLTELYLDKRLECRWKRLNQESTQAITAYNQAIVTHNPVLLELSECFVSALGGEESGSKIIGSHKQVALKSAHDDVVDCVQTHEISM